MTNTTNHTQTALSDYSVDELALLATAGTLKRIHLASGNPRIAQLRNNLIRDYRALTNAANAQDLAYTLEVIDNPNSSDFGYLRSVPADADAVRIIDAHDGDTISDAYDLYLTAYTHLYEQIVLNGLTVDTLVPCPTRKDPDKTRTVFQMACRAVRREIYEHTSIDPADRSVWLSDEIIEGAYIRLGRYYDIGGYCHSDGVNSSFNGLYTGDAETARVVKGMLDEISERLTPRQRTVLHKRMQGKSVVEIAAELRVIPSAVSHILERIQAVATELWPDLVRYFKDKRGND